MLVQATRRLGGATTRLPNGHLRHIFNASVPSTGSVVIHLPKDIIKPTGGGFKPPPPDITLKTTNVPPAGNNGLSLLGLFESWLYSSPPKMECVIVRPKTEPELDISVCLANLMMAVALLAKSLKDSAESKAEGELDEPEGVTEKKAFDSYKAAKENFANCLKKSAPRFDGFRQICEDTVQSKLEGMLKDPSKAKAALVEIRTTLLKRAKQENEDLQEIYAAQDKYILELRRESEQYNDCFEAAHNIIKKERDALDSLLKGFTKEYTVLIKESDGLTIVQPSVVKALERWTKQPNEQNADSVSTALDSQVNDVLKKHGKTGKGVKEFVESMGKFKKKYV